MVALTRLGAVQNPILPIWRESEVRFVTAQLGTEVIVVPGDVARLRPRRARRDAGRSERPMTVVVVDRPRLADCATGFGFPPVISRRCPRLRRIGTTAAVGLLLVGHHGSAKGCAALRPIGDRRIGRRGRNVRRVEQRRQSHRVPGIAHRRRGDAGGEPAHRHAAGAVRRVRPGDSRRRRSPRTGRPCSARRPPSSSRSWPHSVNTAPSRCFPICAAASAGGAPITAGAGTPSARDAFRSPAWRTRGG